MSRSGSASPSPKRLIGAALLLCTMGTATGHAAELVADLSRIAPASSEATAAAGPPSSRVVIEGRAAGGDFSSAVLDVGRGALPTEWQRIATLTAPVPQGLLAQWDTQRVPADRYTVRLTVYSKAGLLRQAQQVVDLGDWRPDLVVRQALHRLDGGKLTVAVELANQGKQPTPASIGITVMGQLDGSAAPVRLARWVLASSLPVGGQASKTGIVTFPPTVTPGRYALTVTLDEEEAIADGDRANNRAVIDPPIELGADVVITQLKAELAADGRSVQARDLVVNQGVLPATAATVRYYLSADGTIQPTDTLLGQRPLPALPAGERSAATTTLPLLQGVQAGTYYLLGRVISGTASNDYWGSSLVLGPDLALAALTVRIDPERRQVVVTDLVKNVGRYDASGAIVVHYRFVPEGTVSQAAPIIGQREVAGGLAAGMEHRAVSAFGLPEALGSGRYVVVARVDPARQFADSRGENNELVSAPLAVGIDLALSNVLVSPAPDGRTVQLTVTSTNRGLLPARGPVALRAFLKREGADNGGTAPLGEAAIEQGIAAGQSVEQVMTVRLPDRAEQERAHLVVEVAPPARETDTVPENNRVATEQISSGVDLVVSEVQSTVSNGGSGNDQVAVSAMVKNLGRQAATHSVSALFVLSASGGPSENAITLGRQEIEPLAAGASRSLSVQWPMPASVIPANYAVRLRIDPDRRMAELKRDNNEGVGGTITIGPDLAWEGLTVQAVPSSGEVVIEDVVKNRSRHDAEGPVVVVYSLVAEGGVLRLSPELGRRTIEGGIKAGAALRQTTRWALPAELREGRYRIVGHLDAQQQLLDSRRDNNQRESGWVVIGYDLAVTAVSAEPSADGSRVTVTDTVANQGWRPTPARVTVRYYLADGVKEVARQPSDRSIGQRVIDAGLQPGEASTTSTLLSLPEGAFHRQWRFVAQVSAGGSDALPDNDLRATASWVNEGVDLAIGDAKATVSPGGDRLTITDTVNNDGRAALNRPVRVSYALSASGLLDGQELLLGHRTVDTLAAGGRSTATTTWPLPATLTPNRYFVVIQTDPERQVAEAKRDNNVTAGSAIAIGPQPVLEAVTAQLGADGQAMAVKVTVANRGNRAMSGPVPVTVGVARDEAGKERVMELGRNTITPLSPGGRAVPVFTLPLPAALPPGSYFVTAQLAEGASAEQVAVTPAALAVGPDLVTRALHAELIGSGEQLKVSITDSIVNQGNQAVTRPFKVSYVLSTDWRLERDDLLVGQRTIERLPAGEAHQATLQFPVPVLTIQTGRYFVLSRIDLEVAVEESNRANNLRPTVEGLLIEQLEKPKGPDLPDVISAPQQTGAVIP